jgi:hypothetical protein
MEQHPIRLLAIFDDEEASLEDRVDAAHKIAVWGRWSEPALSDLPNLFERLLGFWLSLGSPRDGDRAFLRQRVRAGRACAVLSLRLPEGQKVFKNYPRPGEVEGPNRFRGGEITRGRFNHYMASIYEFHFEYPIEGCGIQKDLISLVEENGNRVQLFDWCRQHEVFVFCSRCGLDITYEVSRDCPWRKIHLSKA